jgi:hypothetical protein
MQTEAEFLEPAVPIRRGVAEAFDVDAAREPPHRGDEGPICAAFIAISRPTRRTRLSALRPDIFPLGTVGQLAAHLLLKCIAK